jgi:hypothetical protein
MPRLRLPRSAGPRPGRIIRRPFSQPPYPSRHGRGHRHSPHLPAFAASGAHACGPTRQVMSAEKRPWSCLLTSRPRSALEPNTTMPPACLHHLAGGTSEPGPPCPSRPLWRTHRPPSALGIPSDVSPVEHYFNTQSSARLSSRPAPLPILVSTLPHTSLPASSSNRSHLCHKEPLPHCQLHMPRPCSVLCPPLSGLRHPSSPAMHGNRSPFMPIALLHPHADGTTGQCLLPLPPTPPVSTRRMLDSCPPPPPLIAAAR